MAKINNRIVGVLFGMNNQNYVTLLDSRSKNRFNKLIKTWAINGTLTDIPEEGTEFVFTDLNVVLNDIEDSYKKLENAEAFEKIVQGVFKLINTIRVQNDLDDDDDDLEEDDDD